MIAPLPEELLACPYCSGELDRRKAALSCRSCGELYEPTAQGQPDLRLRRPKSVEVTHVVGARVPTGIPDVFRTTAAPEPEVDLAAVELPGSISRRFASYLPRARRPGQSVALDFGCGHLPARPLLEHAGYRYVGIDYAEPDAPMLADGHALPIRGGTVELVFTVAVLEYLHDAAVGLREIFRVLEPGGRLLGSAAFLTPFLWNTYAHHTHLGVLTALTRAGLSVDALMTDPDYSVLDATALMSLFPQMPGPLRRTAIGPARAAHRAWWRLAQRLGKASAEERVVRNAADFEFLATKRV